MELKKISQEIYNPISENVKKLAELFPAAVKDGQVDFEVLKQELGQFEEVGKEKYELTWPGKTLAKQLANLDIVGRTLKYVPEDSKNPETTENLYIEGDNLEVLKLLRNSYYGKIKMIYIDPPYNTGNDFVYKDDYSKLKEISDIEEGEVSEDGERLIKNQKSSARFHSNWLNMMYPRLKVAKDLLTDDGVIFISIDDNEVDNLRKICDEIFGEENFVLLSPTIMNLKGNQDEFAFAGTHEYTLIYAKYKNNLKIGMFEINEEEFFSEWEQDEIGYFKKGANLKSTGVNAPREKRPNLFYPIFINLKENKVYVTDNDEPVENEDIKLLPITDGKEMSWRWQKSKVRENANEIIISNSNGSYSLYKKQRPGLGDLPTKKPKSIFYKPEYSSGNGTNEFNSLLQVKFGNDIKPKPLQLIKDFVTISTNKHTSDLILDFFSGSATTAHAVMQLNAEDGGNRKFIMVQLPELCPEDSEAYKAGFKTIANIGKERIRRAGEKIKEEFKDKEGIENLDIGFKVFRVGDTNIRWTSEAIKSGQMRIEESSATKDALDFNPGFTDIDVVYEIILRHRDFPLTSKIEKLSHIGERTYIFADSVVVCLEEKMTNEVVDKIAEIEPKPLKVIFRDSAFDDDISLKINTMNRLDVQLKKHNQGKEISYRVEFI
ncbi:MAG: Type III restriction-modification system StyLTI enzyme Mod [Thermoanaerobacterium thermosaccharolyticum]|jgi:adenine-specific DNA-methyltransferase